MEFRTFRHSDQNTDLILKSIPPNPMLDLHQPNYQQKCFVFTDIELTDLSGKYPPEPDNCKIGNGSISTYSKTLPKTKKTNGKSKGKKIAIIAVGIFFLLLIGAGVPFALQLRSSSLLEARLTFIKRLLTEIPLVEGYWSPENLTSSLTAIKEGLVGALLWSVEVPCGAQHLDAVQRALEGIDIAKNTARRHENLVVVDNAADMEKAHSDGLISVILGIQGGHALGASLAVLRSLYHLGTRFISLTQEGCSTPWATASKLYEAETHSEQDIDLDGITLFGQSMISEMNRLGILLEVSGASELAMKQALTVSRAPCLLANSSPLTLCNHTSSISDDILANLPQNGGIIMVNVDHCENQQLTMKDAISYINHVRNMAGVDHIGLSGATSNYPHLLAELARDRLWGNTAIKKLVGGNLVRVLREVEAVRDKVPVNEEWVPEEAIEGHSYCRYPAV